MFSTYSTNKSQVLFKNVSLLINVQKKKRKHNSFGKNDRFQKSRTNHHPHKFDIEERKEPFEKASHAPKDTTVHPITEENNKSNFNGSTELFRKNRTPISKESDIPIPYFSTVITLCTCLAFVGLGMLFYFYHSKKPVQRKIYLQQANHRPPSIYPALLSEEKREMKQQSDISENISLLSLAATLNNSSIWSECKIKSQSLTELSKRFFNFNVDFNCSICNMNCNQATRHSSLVFQNNEHLPKPLQCEARLVKEPEKRASKQRDNEDSNNYINCPVINILTYNGYVKQFK